LALLEALLAFLPFLSFPSFLASSDTFPSIYVNKYACVSLNSPPCTRLRPSRFREFPFIRSSPFPSFLPLPCDYSHFIFILPHFYQLCTFMQANEASQFDFYQLECLDLFLIPFAFAFPLSPHNAAPSLSLRPVPFVFRESILIPIFSVARRCSRSTRRSATSTATIPAPSGTPLLLLILSPFLSFLSPILCQFCFSFLILILFLYFMFPYPLLDSVSSEPVKPFTFVLSSFFLIYSSKRYVIASVLVQLITAYLVVKLNAGWPVILFLAWVWYPPLILLSSPFLW